MSSDAAALWQRWFDEVWGQERDEAIDEMVHPEFVVHGIGGNTMNLAEIKAWRTDFLKSYAVQEGQVLDPIVSGEWISIRTEFTLLSRKDKKTQRIYGQQRARVRDGKFVEVWDSWSWTPALECFGLVESGSLAALLSPANE